MTIDLSKLTSWRVGSFFVLVLFMVAGYAAGANPFKLAAVQSDRGQIGCVKNKSGYQIRVCTTPTTYNKTRNASRYTIHVGVFRAPAPTPAPTPVPIRNAVRCWALYE